MCSSQTAQASRLWLGLCGPSIIPGQHVHQLQSDCPSAGVECRGTRIPSLFYADDVALLSASAQGLQQLLDSMQSFCAANGLTISIPKTEVVVFVGGHHDCVWKVAGQHLKCNKSFTYLGMLS